jgi:hypothetical protein
MSELLIIKAGAEYLRFKADEFAPGPLNKASVFPVVQAEEAKERCRKLVAAGVAAVLMKLTILEEPYTE